MPKIVKNIILFLTICLVTVMSYVLGGTMERAKTEYSDKVGIFEGDTILDYSEYLESSDNLPQDYYIKEDLVMKIGNLVLEDYFPSGLLSNKTLAAQEDKENGVYIVYRSPKDSTLCTEVPGVLIKKSNGEILKIGMF